jgi:hypothetical protein
MSSIGDSRPLGLTTASPNAALLSVKPIAVLNCHRDSARRILLAKISLG